ncbi:MAG: hypothetical protein K2N09_06370 [Muribaculaceae bacterium]|nr:hypothetical protein [Muribaculaceae bacterium]
MKTIVRSLLHLFGIAALLTSLTLTAEGRKIRTKHSIPKKTEKDIAAVNAGQHPSISIDSDSIAFCDSIRPAIRFYGFDKTAGSNAESFFIANSLNEALNGLEIQITYTDMKGRQLHKRAVSIDTTIPSGETLRTDIRSWDTQKSFYYYKSARPKRQSTPFDVKIDLLSVTLDR